MIPVCPKCDEALFILEFKGIAVDYCHKCRGLWFDTGELELLLERTGADASDRLLKFQELQGKRPEGRKTLCPRCDRSLEEVEVKGDAGGIVKVDRCPQGHGAWFDSDELQQMLGMFQPGSGANKTVEFLNDVVGRRR
jgi:hypothetical protein